MEKMKTEKWSPEDISDELADKPEVLKYFRLLPRSLWSRHFDKIEQMRADERVKDEATSLEERQINYLLGILHAREDAIEEYSTNEEFFHGKLGTKESAHSFGDQLRMLLVTSGNLLGAGQTARVKSLKMTAMEERIAVKYLLTPTAKTLSANAEYDMLNEVRTELEIEDIQREHGASDNIRVPHPLFFYKKGRLQCYGMDEINGMTLEQLLQNKEFKKGQDEILAAARTKFSSEGSRMSLFAEVDAFMRDVHEVCLHGDIKLANVMIDKKGRLYLIDFGQSVPLRNMEEKTRDQFENIMDNEREQMRECLQSLFNAIKDRSAEKVAA